MRSVSRFQVGSTKPSLNEPKTKQPAKPGGLIRFKDCNSKRHLDCPASLQGAFGIFQSFRGFPKGWAFRLGMGRSGSISKWAGSPKLQMDLRNPKKRFFGTPFRVNWALNRKPMNQWRFIKNDLSYLPKMLYDTFLTLARKKKGGVVAI